MNSDALIRLGHLVPLSLLPLLRALTDLKRIRSAGHAGSIAERLFAAAWGRVATGKSEAAIAYATVFDALAATTLGDLDAKVLYLAGVPEVEAQDIRRRAAGDAAGSLDPTLRQWVLAAEPMDTPSAAPKFVELLAAQPRAGATCPGRGRLMLEPPESHADHCLSVAVCGVVLAPVWGARAETVFLAALAHHLHNALLPDSGFAGEMMLGAWLEPAMARATTLALDELAPDVRQRVEDARRVLLDVDTPEGCAFHAADTLDRVLQMEHHLRAASTNMDFVLRHMELVHAGPVKPFQDAVLQAVGLAA